MPLALLNAATVRRLPAGPIHHTPAAAGRFRYSPLAASALPVPSSDFLTTSLLQAANAVPPPALRPATASGGAGTPAAGWSMFVYNLAPETEDSTLWQLFGPFGAVLSVKVIRDAQSAKCKGYGFVTMANYEEALAAIAALNGTTLNNRLIQVSFKAHNFRK